MQSCVTDPRSGRVASVGDQSTGVGCKMNAELCKSMETTHDLPHVFVVLMREPRDPENRWGVRSASWPSVPLCVPRTPRWLVWRLESPVAVYPTASRHLQSWKDFPAPKGRACPSLPKCLGRCWPSKLSICRRRRPQGRRVMDGLRAGASSHLLETHSHHVTVRPSLI